VRACAWDRILACVGMTGYPVGRKNENRMRSARQERPGDLRVLSPKPPLRGSTKEMGFLFWLTLCEGGVRLA